MEVEIGEIIINEEINIDEIILNNEVDIEGIELDVIEMITSNVEKYEGEYNIIPLAFSQQELETKDKMLEENLIVKEIPFYEVSNINGQTIYIGSEV